MKLDYRKALEKAARQTIMIHRANTLIKMILRTIVRAVGLSHAGMFIYDKKRDEYVLQVSRGSRGFKIPAGFAKIRKDNPLIRCFTDKSIYFPGEIITADGVSGACESFGIGENAPMKKFLEEVKDALFSYQAHACIPGFFRNDLVGVLFLGEKANKKKFHDAELSFLSTLASDIVMALKNAWLIEDLNRQIDANKRLLLQTIASLASSIEAKDKYTIGHTERVAKYALHIAHVLRKSKPIKNWERFVENLNIAALLHDIGKIGIPEHILHKNVRLNKKEKKLVKTHPLVGAAILEHIEAFQEVLLGVKYHHEKYDGNGYPFRLKGRQIPLIASIIALADTFDAMVTDRPYHKGISREQARAEIVRNRGKQFAPCAVDAFLKAYPFRT
ncbi:MAG: HD domain-containing phosphohydrolase [Candidatus Omnitrophota bacterium]